MATAVPIIGQRGTQNSTTVGNISANNATSTRMFCSEYVGNPAMDLIFSTVNTSPDSNNPIGIVKQFRIDNSGNYCYFGIKPMLIPLPVQDTSCTIFYYQKSIELFAQATIPSSAAGIFTIDMLYMDWENEPVGIASKVLCSASSSVGTGFACRGYVVNRNQYPGPNYVYLDSSVAGLTVSNGTISIGPPYRPYSMRYEFTPTNKADLITCCILQNQSLNNMPFCIACTCYYT